MASIDQLRARWVTAVSVLLFASTALAEPSPPVLRLGGDPTPVRLVSPAAKFDRTFELVLPPDVSLDGVIVRVELRDGEKRLWPVMCTLAGQDCANRRQTLEAPAKLTIAADLPRLGPYTGKLIVEGATTQASGTFELTVDRELAPLGLAVSGGETKLGTYSIMPGDEDYIDIWFALQETSGNDLELQQPQIVGLSFKGTAEASYQSAFHLRLLDNDGKPIDGALKLAASQTKNVRLRIEGIDSAGEYTGKVRWSAAGHTSLDTDFSAVVNEPWYVAFFFIFLGVLAGEGMRRYRREVRPRQIVQRDFLTKVRRYLDAPTADLPEWRREVDAVLRRRAEGALDLVESGGVADEAFIAQLALWQRWTELRTLVLALPEAKRAAFEPPLDEARAAILEAPQKERIAAALKGLEGITDTVRTACRDAAKTRITELLASLTALQKSNPAVSATEIEGVRQNLTDAFKRLDADNRIGAARLYDKAAILYAGITATLLQGAINGAPQGSLTAEQWKKLTSEVEPLIRRIRDSSDPAAAIDAQLAARRVWIGGLVEGLGANVSARLETDPKLQKTSDHVEKARQELAANNLEGAEEAYRLARAAYVEWRGPGGAMSDPTKVSPTDIRMSAFGRLMFPAKQRARTYGERLTVLKLKMAGYSIWFFLASAVIATLSGMQVLWLPDSTWGGWGDWVLALFWGLGLHQVTGALVKGTDEVREKFDAPPAA